MDDSQDKPRRVGRPRSAGIVSDEPTDDAIIKAASRLFRERGYAGTSMREIAHRAGLRKASVYYYFRSKSDILDAMIRAVMVPPIEFIESLDRQSGSAASKLFRLVRFDICQLCSASYDYSAFLVMPEVRSPRYAAFWRDRNDLYEWIRARVADGMASAEFVDMPIDIAARSIFTIEEFTVSWYTGELHPVDQVAGWAARYAVRALLKRSDDIETLASECERLDGVCPITIKS